MLNSCSYQDNVVFVEPQKGHGPKKGRRLSDSQMSSHRPTTDAYPRSYRELGGRKKGGPADIRFAVNSGVNSPPWCVRADDGVHRSLLFNAKQSTSPDRCSPAGSRNASARETLIGVNMTFTVTRSTTRMLGGGSGPDVTSGMRRVACIGPGVHVAAQDHAKVGTMSPQG